MTEKQWTPRKIDAVLDQVRYLSTCPYTDPWAGFRMKARMDLADIVKELRRG